MLEVVANLLGVVGAVTIVKWVYNKGWRRQHNNLPLGQRIVTREECLEQVNQRGPFEGQQPYVYYYWRRNENRMVALEPLLGVPKARNIDVDFEVTEDDRKLFPELENRHVVRIRHMEPIDLCDNFLVREKAYTEG